MIAIKTQPTTYSVSDFYEWYENGDLVLQPKFQRRLVWSENARSFLIDTILRELPIPKLFIRQEIDLTTGRSIREVVDGQQRLQAVFDFIQGALTVFKHHNPELSDQKFEDLPDEVKKAFLAYPFSVDVLLGASDKEVLDIFVRINSYTITLAPQEKLNARFSGAFKQTAYRLGLDYLAFWRNNGILSDQKIARMAEAELASELVVAMLDGFQDGKMSLARFYEKYENTFSQAAIVGKRFRAIINLISEIFDESLRKSPFHRPPLFYSLFCALYDCEFGLPQTKGERVSIRKAAKTTIRTQLLELGNQITAGEPKPEFAEFVTASRRSTDKLKERRTRHTVIMSTLRHAVERSGQL